MSKAKLKAPLRLTSQYVRGAWVGNSAAVDARGRDWYLAGRLDYKDSARRPVACSPCITCGGKVNFAANSHWYQPDGDLVAHDLPQCVNFVYPETVMAGANQRAARAES